METLELLQEFINRRVGTPSEPITLESNLEAVGVDSLMLLDLMFDLEDKYNVRMPDDLPRPETVGDLIAIFDKLKPAATSND
ncbi:MAG: acyl carrier protein [Uliginosibacterium sp.]|jgi:acyl carrier protein|nr:acyl carrier protein [Uliginosibacterium sp.]MBK9393485.1 acyl carrier protein [Uliginosibacterium sp.]MBK9615201.1 acyl carrier protein [Uliginosibacterium sp.]